MAEHQLELIQYIERTLSYLESEWSTEGCRKGFLAGKFSERRYSQKNSTQIGINLGASRLESKTYKEWKLYLKELKSENDQYRMKGVF